MAVAKYFDTATSAWRPLMPGPVGLVRKGTWSSSAMYQAMDFVKNGRSTYLCILDRTATATTPDADTAHWAVLAEGGVDGTGTVSSVAGKLPDVDGNVALTYEDLGGAPAGTYATAAQGELADTALQPAGSVTLTNVWVGTKAEFDALATKDPAMAYLVQS